MLFYEKADARVLTRCRNFIKLYKSERKNEEVFKKASKLKEELIYSLLESHQDANDKITEILNTVNSAANDFWKEYFYYKRIIDSISIILDADAQSVLNELEQIENSNQ